MSCYNPLKGFRSADGAVVFHSKVPQDSSSVTVACGQCRGCRRDRACHWATRCLHEASLYSLNSYVTLTYRDDSGRSLDYSHFQLFMRYLRRARARADRLAKRPVSPVRFFMCGEYGDQLGRPHFHALLFNCDFADRKYFKSAGGNKLYTSEELSSYWTRGFSLVGGVSFQSAAYVARYVMKKVNGDAATGHYVIPETGEIRVPEFCHMSLKPGIGARWLERFGSEVYPEGQVLVNGVLRNAPKYYDRQYKKCFPEAYESMVYLRRLEREFHHDGRLKVMSTVADARDALFSKRKL